MSELQQKLGEVLRLERERKNLKLAHLAESLKISEENLQHVEAGEIDQLPAPLYFSLFAKAYAETLGVDYNATLDAIEADIEERRAEEAAKKAKRESNERAEAGPIEKEGTSGDKQIMWISGAAIVGIAAIMIFLFAFVFEKQGDLSEGAETPADQTIFTEELESQFASYDFGNPPTTPPEPITMTLQANRETWAAIFADGEQALYQTLRPWRLYTVTADHRITASVSYPRSVEIKLNGEVVDLRDPQTGLIRQVRIDQVNLDRWPRENPVRQATPPNPQSRTQQPSTGEPAVEDTQNNTGGGG